FPNLSPISCFPASPCISTSLCHSLVLLPLYSSFVFQHYLIFFCITALGTFLSSVCIFCATGLELTCGTSDCFIAIFFTTGFSVAFGGNAFTLLPFATDGLLAFMFDTAVLFIFTVSRATAGFTTGTGTESFAGFLISANKAL